MPQDEARGQNGKDAKQSSRDPRRDTGRSGQKADRSRSEKFTSRPDSSSNSLKTEAEQVTRYIEDYAGYLAPVILLPAQQTGRSPILIAIALGILAMLLHLSLPIFITPHFSCLWTLVLPLQSTIRLLRAELYPPAPPSRPRSKPQKPEDSEDEDATAAYKEDLEEWDKKEEKRKTTGAKASDAKRHKAAAAQWLLFWLLYTVGSLSRGYVGILRPGWRGWFEVCRTVALTAAGGPWFSPSALK